MKNKSFTLIELLVVIVIIGILAGVIMISTSSSIDKANIAKLKVFEESVQNNLAANMVSAWDADHVTKGATWILNDTWGNNNGTFYDTTSTCSTTLCPQVVTDNEMGNVLFFDGINDHIVCGSNSSLIFDNSLTISLWVKPSGFSATGAYVRRNGNTTTHGWYLFRQGSDRSLQVQLIDHNMLNISSVSSSSFLELNKWFHVLITSDRNTIRLYMNGLIVGTGSDLTSDPLGFGNLYIGNNTALGEWYNGKMKDIKLYNSALSSFQVKQNYIAGLDSLLSKGSISKQDYNQRINTLAYNKHE